MINKSFPIITYKDDEYVNKSAQIINDLIQDLIQNKKSINIALSGGSTPLPIYEKLRTFNLKWKKIKFFMVDERCVSNTNPESNYGNIKKIFFDFIPSLNFPIINSELSYYESAAKYETLIRKHVNTVDKFPQFDLIILGMGLDGHTASLFPETKALTEKKKLVVLNNVPQLNTNRITMTYPLILNSKKIILLIKGEKKRNVLKDELMDDFPISKIIPQIHLTIN